MLKSNRSTERRVRKLITKYCTRSRLSVFLRFRLAFEFFFSSNISLRFRYHWFYSTRDRRNGNGTARFADKKRKRRCTYNLRKKWKESERRTISSIVPGFPFGSNNDLRWESLEERKSDLFPYDFHKLHAVRFEDSHEKKRSKVSRWSPSLLFRFHLSCIHGSHCKTGLFHS